MYANIQLGIAVFGLFALVVELPVTNPRRLFLVVSEVPASSHSSRDRRLRLGGPDEVAVRQETVLPEVVFSKGELGRDLFSYNQNIMSV